MNLKATVTKEKDKNENYLIQKKYSIHEGQYGVWETKGDSLNFVPKGAAVYLSRIINCIDTGEKILDLYFFDAHGCKIKVAFPRKDLSEQGIMALLGFGVQVLKQDAKALIVSILNQEPDVPCILKHEALGFTQYDTHTVFLAKKSIGVESRYGGKLRIGKKGSYKIWKKMVEDEVLGNIPLEFILAVAGSSVLVDYLREKVQIENVIVSMIGESSSGKTSAGLLMVSCGAKPSFKGDSLVFNFSDTQNALMALIKSGFPALIDEGSLCMYKQTQFLYNISMGKEKERCSIGAEKYDSSYFNTSIAITSEKSLLGMADENSGLLVRILEIENVVWTKDARSADKIKNTIYNNYGWLIPKLAELILNYESKGEQDEIISCYWQWNDYLVQRARKQGNYNSLTERACKQYALILLSASLIQMVMDIELHIDDIVEFIEAHNPVKDADHADIGSRALIYLKQYITKYYTQFVHPDDDSGYTPQNCLGRIKNVRSSITKSGFSYGKRLYVTDVILEKILREGKFPDKKVILKKWKEAGILKCEKDRYLSNIIIANNLSVKGYIINLPETEEHSCNSEIMPIE